MNVKSPPSKNGLVNEGDFYVESQCCLLCGVPEDIVPEVFQTGENNCFVKRQPCSQNEIDRTIRAMWSSEVTCVRYRGNDAALLDRLAKAGMAGQADRLSTSRSQTFLRNRVSFNIGAGTALPASAAGIAGAFRADMRTSGKTALSGLFDRRTSRIAWYRNRFHRVRFSEESDARFIAHLRSRTALQGLAWILDDWLRAKGAETIRWEATSDPTSVSSTPM